MAKGRWPVGSIHTISSINGCELWTGEAESLRDAVEKAVRAGASLAHANLAGASLRGASLADADLWCARLRCASLARADLRRANLEHANLADADLRANLAHANLRRANLEGANLAHADLRANLTRASLARANLEGANLEGANLEGANLAGANLEGVKGLDYCAGGWVLGYGWTLLRRPGLPVTLRYGCVERPLAEWVPDAIEADCFEWARGDGRYLPALTALVAYCTTVDALYPTSMESLEDAMDDLRLSERGAILARINALLARLEGGEVMGDTSGCEHGRGNMQGCIECEEAARARVAELRGLIAECLALNPIVSGDMEKVRVWADLLRRMKKEASDG